MALSLATGSGAKALLDHSCATVTSKRDTAHRWWHSLSCSRWQGFVAGNCVRERKLGNCFATAGFSCQVRKCDVGRLQCAWRLESYTGSGNPLPRLQWKYKELMVSPHFLTQSQLNVTTRPVGGAAENMAMGSCVQIHHPPLHRAVKACVLSGRFPPSVLVSPTTQLLLLIISADVILP